MKKDLFVRSLNNLKKYNDWEQKLYELGINFWEQPEIQNLIESYLDLLAYCCNDERNHNDYNEIDYFVYEQDFGKNSNKYYITEADGTEIKNKTINDLWCYLVKLHPEIEDKEIEQNKNSGLSSEELQDIFEENFK